jgi:hypothetical protein
LLTPRIAYAAYTTVIRFAKIPLWVINTIWSNTICIIQSCVVKEKELTFYCTRSFHTLDTSLTTLQAPVSHCNIHTIVKRVKTPCAIKGELFLFYDTTLYYTNCVTPNCINGILAKRVAETMFSKIFGERNSTITIKYYF